MACWAMWRMVTSLKMCILSYHYLSPTTIYSPSIMKTCTMVAGNVCGISGQKIAVRLHCIKTTDYDHTWSIHGMNISMLGKYSEYLCVTNQDNIGINGFLWLFITHICRTFAAESPPNPHFLGPDSGVRRERYHRNCAPICGSAQCRVYPMFYPVIHGDFFIVQGRDI